ncbi:MAG TPA: PAS domain-containing protein, partial [Aquabacterium sp.]|nr:PAS domain-containing protein [Aquabacterium sp.]
MKHEHVLPVLYDLTLTIGREVQVRPLLTRVLQRLLFHTSFPAGLVLLQEPGGETGQCMAAIGDRALTDRIGQPWDGPPLWTDEEPGWLDAVTVQALGASPRLGCALRLPVPGCGVIVLLAPQVPASEQPLAQVLAPVLRNLARAIELCRVNEALTQRLQEDRDQARSDLAAALRDSEAQRRLLRLLTDTLPDLFWLKDLEGRYLFCNPGFERLYGAREAQILGRTDGDFVDDDLAA